MSETSNSFVAPRLRRRPLVRERRGAMLVFVAVSMVVLIGFLVMTLDVGAGNRQRRIAQTAADAGALGGGTEIYRQQSPDSVRASALNEAVRNGFVAGDVTVNYPPLTGPHAGNNQYVEVLINKTIPTIFGSFFKINSLTIAARGVAGVGSYSLNCLFSLNPTGSALQVDNGGELDTNCGIVVNSTSSDALNLVSSGLVIGGGSGIAIAGNWTGNPKKLSPAPDTGTAPAPNPLLNIQTPTVGPCTHTGLLTLTQDTLLTPGVYCGGINISGKKTTLSPGTYIISGGGFTVGSSGTVVGDGVTLFNTTNATYPFGVFNFGTGCKATLSAPTSPGDLQGILMFEDPADPPTVGNTNLNTFACAGDDPSKPELTGTLYFPTETIYFNGSNTTTNIDGSVVAYNVEVSGKVSITMDTSGSTALHRLSLVE